MKKLTTTLCALLLFAGSIFSQATADLTIQNQQVSGTDFLFDIYLTRTEVNDVYLGTADFVLTFNSAAFTSPTILREGSSFWNLTSTSENLVNSIYRTATSPAPINGNEIIINLNQVSFGDQEEFDDIVARINNTPSTHRVGRYRVTGINDPSAFMNLQWKTSGAGVTTQIFTLAPVSPWASSAVTINAINPGNEPLPVELTSFTVTANGADVILKWRTETETNNYGFEIERKSPSPIPSLREGASQTPLSEDWGTIGFVEGNGNSSAPKEYSFKDNKLLGGSKFSYRLKQIDIDGQFKYSDIVEVEVVPDRFELFQNYPNPFNPTTKIQWQSPVSSHQTLRVYDILGNEVITLLNEFREAGKYEVIFNAGNLSSGVYLYRLQAGEQSFTKKMTLIK
jgi:hypothetical protein